MPIHDVNLSFEALSESAMLIHLNQCIDIKINARVHQLCRVLREAHLAGIEDIMPAYASVLLRFDPETFITDADSDPHQTLWQRIQPLWSDMDDSPADPGMGRLHELPVCYGEEYGEDLEAVAAHCGLTPAQVVERHCAPEYHVAMLGFAPGFAYLLGLDPALEIPRHDKPRTRVPAGSVGIGGAQTGIYPRQLPGGWQLLGRTSERLFDIANTWNPVIGCASFRSAQTSLQHVKGQGTDVASH